MTHNEETHMNLSWLWPKLVLPKSRSAKLEEDLNRKNPESGCARDPADAFIEACERDLNIAKRKLAQQDRLDEIGKIAHLILVQTVANAETNTIHPYKRYKLQPRDVQAAWDSAAEIFDLTQALISRQEVPQLQETA